MAVAAFEPFWPHAFAEKWEIRSLGIEALLRTSDIVTIHCPLTPETRNLIGTRELNLMKPEALLINTSRGGIIDEEAMAKSLEAGKIAGAGLDAFEREPLSDSPLLKLENVILTPHMAWFTRESVTRMEDGIADQLIDFSRGRIPSHPANPDALNPVIPEK
jgi:phosphoglycerate dehydrogenase-like enzyme